DTEGTEADQNGGYRTPAPRWAVTIGHEAAGVAVHRTAHYAQLLRPPCARVGVLGSGLWWAPCRHCMARLRQAVEATNAELPLIDQAQSAPKRELQGPPSSAIYCPAPGRSARALRLGHFPIMVMHPLCRTVPSAPSSRMERSKGTVGPSI